MFSGTLWRPLGKDVCVGGGGRRELFISWRDSAMVWLTLGIWPDGELDLGFRLYFYSLAFHD